MEPTDTMAPEEATPQQAQAAAELPVIEPILEQAEATAVEEEIPVRRGPGRPKGSKNKSPRRQSRRPRATRDEMGVRQQGILDFIAANENPVSINEVADAVSLPYHRAAALVRKMIDEGRVSIARREGKKFLLALGSPQEVTTVTEVAGVNVNTLLQHIHLGREFEVVGFHVTKESLPTVEMQGSDGEVMRFSLVQ